MVHLTIGAAVDDLVAVRNPRPRIVGVLGVVHMLHPAGIPLGLELHWGERRADPAAAEGLDERGRRASMDCYCPWRGHRASQILP